MKTIITSLVALTLVVNVLAEGSKAPPTATSAFMKNPQTGGLKLNGAGNLHAGLYGLLLVAENGGSIVAISSTASILSSPYLAAYCAGKAAVDQMVRVAADELGDRKVRVNSVRPGLTRTGATGGMFEMAPVLDRFLVEQPLARGGEPEDIGRVVRFLAGELKDYCREFKDPHGDDPAIRKALDEILAVKK